MKIQEDDGTLVRVNDVIADAYVVGDLEVGSYATFYFRGSRVYRNVLRRSNILLATDGARGLSFQTIAIYGYFPLTGMLVLASPVIALLFGFPTLGYITYILLGVEAAFFASFWPLWLWFAFLGAMVWIKLDAVSLRSRLTREAGDPAGLGDAARAI